MANPLLAGLVAGFQSYANQRVGQNLATAKKQEDAELAAAAQKAAEWKAKFEASLRAPQVNTFEDVDAEGKPVKRTRETRYDLEKGLVSEDLGVAPIRETPRNIDPNSPEGIEARLTVEREKAKLRPAGGSGSGDSSSREEKKQDALDAREKLRQDATSRRMAAAETAKVMRELNSDLAVRNAAKQYGIDPTTGDVRSKLRKAILNENLMTLGVDAEEEAEAEAIEVLDGETNSPPALKTNTPKTAETPYPDGTSLKGPDGKIYVVRNGVPVPQDS